MESESKVNAVAEVSEQTNQLSVVADSSMILSESTDAKKEDAKKGDVDRDDSDRKRRREDSRDRSVRRSKDRGDRRSRDRGDRKSRRDRSVSKERRRGSADRHKRHDRDRDRDREKEKDSGKEKEREKEKDGDSVKERDKKDDKERDRESRTSRSDKDRERDRERDRDRDRDRDKDRTRSTRDRERESRDRRGRRSRSRSPDRRRGRDSRRRSRSASSEDRRRSRRRSSSPSPSDKKKSSSAEGDKPAHKPVTLRDIIAANPGISVQEAAIRLNAYNTAVARGLTPDPIAAPIRGAPGVAPAMGAGIPGMAAGMGMGLPGSASSGMLAGMGIANPLLAGGIGANAMGGMGLAGEGGAATKAQRELYVGNLPPGITVPQLAEFLNAAFKQLGLCKDATQNTVITAWVSPESHYAFVELRTVEEATAALTYLNGIQVGMFSLKFGRPKGYTGGASSLAVPMMGATPSFNNPLLTTSMLGSAVGLGASNPLLAGLSGSLGMAGAEAMSHTIMVTNLPALISEQQIRELFTPFGELKAFNTIRTTTGQTQSAVFEYADSALTDGVVSGMNNLDIAGQKLSVQRIPHSSAAVLLQPNAAVPPAPSVPPPAPAGPPPSTAASQVDELASYPPSAVIRMSNMTTPQDLSDDQSYEELMEDVADECNSHGTVKSIVIPRSGADSSVGKIFVHFVDVSGAQASRKAVAGRKFNGRVVEAYFYPEELFLKKIYTLPEGYLAGEAGASKGNGNRTHTAGSSDSGGDINDIDEGERPAAAPAVDAYDPTASMEDLD